METTKVLKFWGKEQRNEIAAWYDGLPNVNTPPTAGFQTSIHQLVADSFNLARRQFWCGFVDYDPYPTADHMRAYLRNNGGLLISTLYNNSDIMPGNVNLMFRFAHDIDHCMTEDCNFAFAGEVCAYSKFAARAKQFGYSTFMQQWLFTEIVGQAASRGTNGVFADQKFAFAPKAWVFEVEKQYGY